MKLESVGVLGAGQMGIGIAQVFAQAGVPVFLGDRDLALAESGKAKIAKQLERVVSKGKLTASEMEQTLNRIQPVASIQEVARGHLVIEAVTENPDLKKKLLRDLSEALSDIGILVTNTSSISITELAAVTKFPEKFAGMHFMNPVPVMKLVEGISALQTSPETFHFVRSAVELLGKTFVEGKDMPGFIVNRILMPMINEAVYTLSEGIGSVEGIDTAMKLGTNQPMGPLELADFIGLDTCLAIMEVLHTGLGDTKYRPAPLLRNYVKAGWLGRKSGRGFYKY
jgi:3-hydroxybutyryl-CoA dehydrogenase